MKERIGIVCNVFGQAGGMERYALDMISYLISDGIEPVVFTKKEEKTIREEFPVEVHVCNMQLVPKIFEEIYFSHWLRTQLDTCELLGVIGCCRNACSDILICGGTHKGFCHSMRRNKFKDRVISKFEQYAFERAKIIVAHSKLMKQELVSYYGIDEKKVEVLYPPVDDKRFRTIDPKEKQTLREKLGMEDGRKYFILPSSDHKRKGVNLISRIFERTNLPASLLVFGKREKDVTNVKYMGRTNEIEKYYQAGDCTILASEYEPFGLVGVESVLCRTPVLFPKNIGCTEVIKSPGWLEFDLRDERTLENAIARIVNEKRHYFEPDDVILYDYSTRNHFSTLINLLRQNKK